MPPLLITPQTRIADLLEHYPQLEEPLIELAPEFRKLHNPVLRRTIAKVVSLQQAANIGHLPVMTLVNQLRARVGQDRYSAETGATDYISPQPPTWFAAERIARTLDIRPLLDAGQMPLERVLQELRIISPGQIFEIITAFLPAPLIDKVRAAGYTAWSKVLDAEFRTYFYRETGGSENPDKIP